MSEPENIIISPTEIPVGAGIIPPATPTIPPTPKKFPYLATILLIILALVAGICIYIFLQVRSTAMEKSISPSPSPVASVDPTADWQTYTNIKYGYTLKVPTDWKINSSEPGPGEIPLTTSSRGLVMYPASFLNAGSAKTNITLEIDGIENLTYKNYEEWLSATTDPFFDVIKRGEIDFHGVNSRFIVGSYDGYGYPASMTVRSFPSPDKNNYFSISTTQPTEENLAQNTVDQILSTFKFTN